MSLDNLAKIGQLEKIVAQPNDIQRLLEAAQRALRDAGTPGLSNESRFDLAYRAIMQAANAALQSSGWRTLTSRPGHHQTMIQTLSLTVGLDKAVVIQLDALRKQRNVIDYSGDLVGDAMVADALRHAAELIALVSGKTATP